MTNEDAVKWLENLKQDIGKHQHSELWHYEQALSETEELLKEQPAEIERLNDKLRIMYNRCICFCGSQNCSECKQREECESKRSFWHGYYLLHGKRVKKDGEA